MLLDRRRFLAGSLGLLVLALVGCRRERGSGVQNPSTPMKKAATVSTPSVALTQTDIAPTSVVSAPAPSVKPPQSTASLPVSPTPGVEPPTKATAEPIPVATQIPPQPTGEPSPTPTPIITPESGIQVILQVPSAGVEILERLPQGSTVGDLLTAIQKRGFSLQASSWGFLGQFIEEVAGVSNDPGSGRWLLYLINDQIASLGVSHQQLGANDKVVWQLV